MKHEEYFKIIGFLDNQTKLNQKISVTRLRAFFPTLARSTAYRYLKQYRTKQGIIPKYRYRKNALISKDRFCEKMKEILQDKGFKSSRHLYNIICSINGISRSTFKSYFKRFRDENKNLSWYKKTKYVIYRSKTKITRGFYTIKRQPNAHRTSRPFYSVFKN